MNLDQLRDTFRQWQDAPGPNERNEHLKTLRTALTPTPVADDPVTAALAQVDPDAPDLQAQLRAALEPARPTARRLSEIHDPRPDPLLSLAGSGGLLSVGDVCMLSGEGGIAKSALAVGLAVDVANANDGKPSAAGPLTWHGGPADTLLVSYEDHPAHVAWRARRYAELMHGAGADLDRVRVLSLADPMFGPAESERGAALYNARPKPLPGWADVATAARETGARLIVIGQQAHVVGEHAEDEPVDEVRDHGRIVATRPQRLGDGREGRRRPLGKGAPGLARPQPLGIRKGPLQPVTDRAVGEVVEVEFIGSTDAVRPVGADAEPPQVGDDQQRRVLQRQRILPELRERRIKVGALAFVLPGEAVALPDVGPAVAARVFANATFKAIRRARRIGLSRRRLVQEPTEVEEVLMRRRPLFQRGIAPLGDKGVRRHAEVLAWRDSRV